MPDPVQILPDAPSDTTPAAPAETAPVAPVTQDIAAMSVAELLDDSKFPAPQKRPQADDKPAKAAESTPLGSETPKVDAAEAAPSDEAAASKPGDEPSGEGDTAVAKPVTVPDEAPYDAALVAKLVEENLNWRRLKGKRDDRAQEAADRIAALEQSIQELRSGKAKPADAESEVDPTAALLEDPDAKIDSRISAYLQKQAEQAATERQQELLAVAPEVGFQLFANRYSEKIGPDAEKWGQSEEGQAVLKIVREDEDLQDALAFGITTGRPDKIARVMGKAYQRHQILKQATSAKAVMHSERQRIDAQKAASTALPRPAATRPSNGVPKSIYQMDWKDMLDDGRVSDDAFLGALYGRG